MSFIGNSNFDGSCLNEGNLHLNRKVTAALAENLGRLVRSLLVDCIIYGREGAFMGCFQNIFLQYPICEIFYCWFM